MTDFFYLIPVALALGAVGLAAFMWSLKSGQYEDLEGAAERILSNDDKPIVKTRQLGSSLEKEPGSSFINELKSQKICESSISPSKGDERSPCPFWVISDQFGLPRDVPYAAVRDRNSGHRGQSIFALPCCF